MVRKAGTYEKQTEPENVSKRPGAERLSRRRIEQLVSVEDSYDGKEFHVNWAAIGAVSPADAITFAFAVYAAALEAMEKNLKATMKRYSKVKGK